MMILVRVLSADCSVTCWANAAKWYLYQASRLTTLYDDVDGLRLSCNRKLVPGPFDGLGKLYDGMSTCDATLIIHGRRSCSKSDRPRSCNNDAGPGDDHEPEAAQASCSHDGLNA